MLKGISGTTRRKIDKLLPAPIATDAQAYDEMLSYHDTGLFPSNLS